MTKFLLISSFLMLSSLISAADNKIDSKDSLAATIDPLIEQIYTKCVKIGNFTLKCGEPSPIHFNLCSIISYPAIMQALAERLYNLIKYETFDVICAVPNSALGITTAMSLYGNRPMIFKRKEGAKDHGTKKVIEGVFKKGDTCLVVEDVITTGSSILETITALESEGLVVKDIVVCVDREQSGMENIRSKGYRIHALYTITEFMDQLLDCELIDMQFYDSIKRYIQNNKFPAK